MATSKPCSSLLSQDVMITSKFWTERIDTIRSASIPAIYEHLKETGRWDSLKLKWKPGDPNKPHQFWDSDVAKWLEAACYSLAQHSDHSLAQLVEEAVDMIRGAQQEDGYINTYYTVVEPGKRWTNIAWSHEMYNAGHLLEAGLAHHAYSGSFRLLGPILKFVKHISSVFGPEEGKKKGYPGHQELELALLKAYEAIGDETLLDLARFFIEERGQHRPEGHYYDIEAKARGELPRPGPGRGPPYSYNQADRPIREMTSIEGHSVRAMYWLTGVAALSRLTKDSSLLEAAKRLWESMRGRKMYVTGGLGAMPEWEGFGPDHFLPNETGYLETCAAIGLAILADQMLLADYDADVEHAPMDYAKTLDLALHNGVLAGVSLDGRQFFYENPLATIGKYLSRKSWFDVSCCPPNVARLMNSIGRFIYHVNDDDVILVRLYISSTSTLTLSDDTVIVEQETGLPWDGRISLTVQSNQPVPKYQLRVPTPLGAERRSVSASCRVTRGLRDSHLMLYPEDNRTHVRMYFTFSPRRILPHELDLENKGCVAIGRGPLIYCAETIDNEHIGDLRRIRLADDAVFEEEVDEERFADCKLGPGSKPIVLKTQVRVVSDPGSPAREECLTLIPYFTWANRGKSDLRVWLPRA